MAMLEREVRDFRRAVLELMQKTGSTFQQANHDAAYLLGVVSPFDGGALPKMPLSKTRRRAGAPTDEGLSKRDAVAAVAVYFESVGAGKEQAINDAKRWLNIKLSRKVAKVAVLAFKANTSPEQYEPQARWAYLTFKPGTTQPLPSIVVNVRKRRQTKRG
jgi:hypothetical protein